MKVVPANIINTNERTLRITQAKAATLDKNWEKVKELIQPFFDDSFHIPEINCYSNIVQAEILLIFGIYISNTGKSYNQKEQQEKAKDFITQSITKYETDRSRFADEISDAKIYLANCCFSEGRYADCEFILKNVELTYKKDKLNPIYLKAAINRLRPLYCLDRTGEALELIESLAVAVEESDDDHLNILFHNLTAMIYRVIGVHEKALDHLHKSLTLSLLTNSWRHSAMNYNNLANLLSDADLFDQAHSCIDQALELFSKFKEYGFVGQVLESKAEIFLKENKIEDALETINRSIKILSAGEDVGFLAEAQFFKVKILHLLDRVGEAVMIMGELLSEVLVVIGEESYKLYEQRYKDIQYSNKNLSFVEEVNKFRLGEITKAFLNSKLSPAKAADVLKIELTNLIGIIDADFPFLYEQLGFVRPEIKLPESSYSKPVREISATSVIPADLNFADYFSAEYVEDSQIFYVSSERAVFYNLDFDALIAVKPIAQVENNIKRLVRNLYTNQFHIGTIKTDPITESFIFVDEIAPDPLFLEDVFIIGKPFAYCPLNEDSHDMHPLP